MNMATDQWQAFEAAMRTPDDVEAPAATPVPIMTEEEEAASFMAFMNVATGQGVSSSG